MLNPRGIVGIPIPEANATIEALGKITTTCINAKKATQKIVVESQFAGTNLSRKILPLQGLEASAA